ncbi:MAG: class I SAM-dependent methyltransferase [Burkholderiales bacterium]|nr:class I SAM-dependent methyltransferase [Burkholderiales bacterium]
MQSNAKSHSMDGVDRLTPADIRWRLGSAHARVPSTPTTCPLASLHHGRQEWRQQCTELEALLALGERLGLSQGLPYAHPWSAGADFLTLLALYVRTYRPACIVECGSGLSSLILARCCALNGHGRVWSLEHLPACAAHTRDWLGRYGLGAFATVLDAPLVPQRLGGKSFPWYALEGLSDLPAIDLLVVDGPPAGTGRLARYPALPLLYARLAPRCAVFLDDADRPDEQAVIERWRAEYPDLGQVRLTTGRGCALFARALTPHPGGLAL